jgi:hypothetical protein
MATPFYVGQNTFTPFAFLRSWITIYFGYYKCPKSKYDTNLSALLYAVIFLCITTAEVDSPDDFININRLIFCRE